MRFGVDLTVAAEDVGLLPRHSASEYGHGDEATIVMRNIATYHFLLEFPVEHLETPLNPRNHRLDCAMYPHLEELWHANNTRRGRSTQRCALCVYLHDSSAAG